MILMARAPITALVLLTLLTAGCGGAAAPPPEPKPPVGTEEALSAAPAAGTEDSSEDTAPEPGEIVAPPPAYGNKVVRGKRPNKPRPGKDR